MIHPSHVPHHLRRHPRAVDLPRPPVLRQEPAPQPVVHRLPQRRRDGSQRVEGAAPVVAVCPQPCGGVHEGVGEGEELLHREGRFREPRAPWVLVRPRQLPVAGDRDHRAPRAAPQDGGGEIEGRVPGADDRDDLAVGDAVEGRRRPRIGGEPGIAQQGRQGRGDGGQLVPRGHDDGIGSEDLPRRQPDLETPRPPRERGRRRPDVTEPRCGAGDRPGEELLEVAAVYRAARKRHRRHIGPAPEVIGVLRQRGHRGGRDVEPVPGIARRERLPEPDLRPRLDDRDLQPVAPQAQELDGDQSPGGAAADDDDATASGARRDLLPHHGPRALRRGTQLRPPAGRSPAPRTRGTGASTARWATRR